MAKRAMVVTTINAPTPAVAELAARSADWPLVVVGDAKTPSDWAIKGARYLSLTEQLASTFTLAPLLPVNHYCRKNLGYLDAIAHGASVIAETDDDNFPEGWPTREPEPGPTLPVLDAHGWANVYRYFTDAEIWPRGLPLGEIRASLPSWEQLKPGARQVGVHQFLASGDPDVDAIYRLTVGRADHEFLDRSVVLERGTVVPFNSQSTIWSEAAFPLLYLPSFVSFRMTDIWRSFVAQVCLWAADLHVAYHGVGVRQERNAHDLQRDFLQEVVGYERNDEIFRVLSTLDLSRDPAEIGANLRACYLALLGIGVVQDVELALVDAWLADLAAIRAANGR